MNDRKVLIIGLDGADELLTARALDAGWLPNLARLARGGSWGPLRSTLPPITAPAWTSFMTGTNPGRHGIYNFVTREPGSYRLLPVNIGRCRVPTMWQILKRHGKRGCAFNIPMTYPPQAEADLMVAGVGTPSADHPYCHPAAVKDELLARGLRGHGPDVIPSYTANLDGFLARVEEILADRVRTFVYLLRRQEWDLMMGVFISLDRIHHVLLNYVDERCPEARTPEGAKYRAVFERIYRQVDAAVGEVLAAAPAGTATVLMSDHGATALDASLYLNNWLHEQGWLVFAGGAAAAKSRGYDLLKKHLPTRLKGLLLRTMNAEQKKEKLKEELFLERIDWGRTRAYARCGTFGGVGQIHLNRQGREPQGTVAPDDGARVSDEIIAGLKQLSFGGQPVVEAVWRREEIYSGPALDEAPDIVFLTRGMRIAVQEAYEEGVGAVAPLPRDHRGAHAMNGILLCHGPGFTAGAPLAGAEIVDVLPTLLHYLGLPVPRAMDGKVLTGLLTAPGTVAYDDGAPPESAPAAGYSAAEEAQVMEKLRGIGYL